MASPSASSIADSTSTTSTMGEPASITTTTTTTSSQAPQLAMLDFFFPGFSMFAGAAQRHLGIDLNLYFSVIAFFGVLTVAWSYSSSFLWEKVESHFMSSVDIRTDDEIYNIIMAWIADQSFSQSARRFVVNADLSSRVWYLRRWGDDDDEDSGTDGDQNDDGSGEEGVGDSGKKPLNYTPSFGTHYFFYKGRLLLFKRNSKEQKNGFLTVSEREEISICCFGRNPRIIKRLLQEARVIYNRKDRAKTLIYRGTSRSGTTEPTWQRCLARNSRPFSTVILNEKVKSDLIADVTDYLRPATQRWYSNRGIPYRRGYLLHGPPGTGKSSLSLALAGFFRMRIYIVSLSSISSNEENLSSLFAELPRRCVVLLEDIDTAGLTHTRDGNGSNNSGGSNNAEDADTMVPGQLTTGNGDTNKDNNNNNNNNGSPSRLSLSGLLNILDGVASQEGRVLIMTTNHIEKLDRALIRPGRVDMIVEFGRADADMTAAIFRAIFARLEADITISSRKPKVAAGQEDDENGLSLLSPEEKQKQAAAEAAAQRDADARVEAMALEFAARIPALEFSPAEIQGHLLRHKRNPRAAVDGADEFVAQTRRDRKEKEIKEAEDRRKEAAAAEEEKKKEKEKEKADEEEKSKRVAEKKSRRKEAKKAERRRSKRKQDAKESKTRGDVSANTEDDEPSSSSSTDSESENTKQKEKKTRTKKKSRNSSKAKTEDSDSSSSDSDSSSSDHEPTTKPTAKEQDEEASRPVAPIAPINAGAEEQAETKTFVPKHEKKDSGYGTPTSVEA